MKKVLIALLMLAPMLCWAEKPAANPADYTITVHVQSSAWKSYAVNTTAGLASGCLA